MKKYDVREERRCFCCLANRFYGPSLVQVPFSGLDDTDTGWPPVGGALWRRRFHGRQRGH